MPMSTENTEDMGFCLAVDMNPLVECQESRILCRVQEIEGTGPISSRGPVYGSVSKSQSVSRGSTRVPSGQTCGAEAVARAWSEP